MKSISLTILICFLLVTARAQKTVAKYRSQIYAGWLVSDGTRDFHIQTIQGINVKHWTVGAGGGIDWYRFKTIPVFLSVTRDLFKKNAGPFVTVSAGTNYPVVKKELKVYADSRFLRGGYGAAAIGYKFEGNKKNTHCLIISTGYSYKKVREERPFYNYCPGGCTPTEATEKISYTLQRIDFKIGWQF
jgi:hypothetical protein